MNYVCYSDPITNSITNEFSENQVDIITDNKSNVNITVNSNNVSTHGYMENLDTKDELLTGAKEIIEELVEKRNVSIDKEDFSNTNEDNKITDDEKKDDFNQDVKFEDREDKDEIEGDDYSFQTSSMKEDNQNDSVDGKEKTEDQDENSFNSPVEEIKSLSSELKHLSEILNGNAKAKDVLNLTTETEIISILQINEMEINNNEKIEANVMEESKMDNETIEADIMEEINKEKKMIEESNIDEEESNHDVKKTTEYKTEESNKENSDDKDDDKTILENSIEITFDNIRNVEDSTDDNGIQINDREESNSSNKEKILEKDTTTNVEDLNLKVLLTENQSNDTTFDKESTEIICDREENDEIQSSNENSGITVKVHIQSIPLGSVSEKSILEYEEEKEKEEEEGKEKDQEEEI